VIVNNINMFILISETESFGINTDILETNILNLAVVIGVLIYYGRITFPTCSYYTKLNFNRLKTNII
jgi:hypothetical protein